MRAWRRVRNIAFAVGLALLAGSHGAYATVTSVATLTTWDFSGACFDCFGGNGTATGSFVLQDYTPGTALDSDNFVSFTYDGTDLTPGFTVQAGDLQSIDGNLPVPGGSLDLQFNPGIEAGSAPSVCAAAGSYSYFTVDSSGNWNLGNYTFVGCTVGDPLGNDTGTNAQINAAVPEPSSLALFGAALVGLGVTGRRKRRPA